MIGCWHLWLLIFCGGQQATGPGGAPNHLRVDHGSCVQVEPDAEGTVAYEAATPVCIQVVEELARDTLHSSSSLGNANELESMLMQHLQVSAVCCIMHCIIYAVQYIVHYDCVVKCIVDTVHCNLYSVYNVYCACV